MSRPLQHSIRTRVRYAETDQGGVVYHSNYFVYFEVARTELLRSLGVPYRDVEDRLGVTLAIVECQARYRAPARYDDMLRVDAAITKLSGTRIWIEYRIIRESDERLLCEGGTTLASIRDGTPTRMPDEITRACAALS